jgi:phosphoenolpyruvate carboxykinase (ATP)
VDYQNYDVFNLSIPTSCPGVPKEVLNPSSTWASKEEFSKTTTKLANLFTSNFKNYASEATPDVLAAGPKV